MKLRATLIVLSAAIFAVAYQFVQPRIAAQGRGASQAPADSELDGTLEVIYEDGYTAPRLRHFLRVGTDRVELNFGTRPKGLVTGSRIRARGRLRNNVLALDESDVQPLGGSGTAPNNTIPLSSPNTFGVQSTLVILFNFQDNVQQPYTPASAQNVTFSQVNNFDLENSFQQASLSGTVAGWYTINTSSTALGCNYAAWASLADTAAQNAGYNLNLYPRRVYGFPQTTACNWWGLGTIGGGASGGTPSRAWINGVYSLRVVAHEMGHNFGLYHSRSNICDSTSGCFVDEYGDDHDVMGGGPAGVTGHFNAYQKEHLGWLDHGASPTIQAVTGSGQYALEPYATTWGGNPKALRILKSSSGGSNTYIYAEARTQSGADSVVTPGVVIHTGMDTDGAEIYEQDLEPSTTTTDFILDPGQSITFSDAVPPVTLTTLSANNSGATIQVTQACSYSLGASGQSIAYAGGGGSVALTTGSDCAWTAASDSPWLTVDSGSTSGTGSASVQFTVATNPSASQRIGTLTIGGKTFTVTQAGNTCSYVVSPLNPTVNHTAASYSVGVTTTSTCAWTAASNAPWIAVTSGASGTGNGTVTYSVAASSVHVPRSGTISVATETVTVTQQGVAAVLAIPADGATNVKTSSVFVWTGVAGAQSYQLIVGTTPGGSDLVNSPELPTSPPTFSVNNLPASQLLYARLRTRWDATTTTSSSISFTTVDRATSVQVIGAQSPNPLIVGGSAQFGATAATSVKASFTGNTGGCTVTFNTTGLPSGASATFSPASVASSAVDQYSLLTIATNTATAPGTYSFNVRAQENAACGSGLVTATAQLVVLATTTLSTGAVTGTYGATSTLSATLSAGAAPVGGKTVSFTLNGNPAGSAVTNVSGVATVSVASLAGVAAGTYSTGIAASFTGDANYGASNANNSLTVSPKTITPSVTVANKSYDGSATATLTNCALAGVTGGDVVTCSSAGTATFDTPNVGSGKTVTVTGLSLSGAAAPNYSLASATATTTAAISGAGVFPIVAAASKTYDGTAATLLTTCAVTGIVPGDSVNCTGTATFVTASAGVEKAVNVVGIALTGPQANNYTLSATTASISASVTQASVSAGVSVANKPYDGTAAAVLAACTLTGVVAGDAVNCTGTAIFDSAAVGLGKTVSATGLALFGAAAGNYLLSTTTATANASIMAASVAPHITAANKAYDGTTFALTSCSLSGAVAGDAAGCSATASFDSASVGIGKTVTASDIALTGVNAGNYTLSTTTTTTSASIFAITVAPITLVESRPYNGLRTAGLASCTLAGGFGTGLVGAYSFEESGGSRVVDWSGHGNDGTLLNAIRTSAGKLGQALVFNGIDAKVMIPESPSLDLTTGMTLEAWVRPSVVDDNWRDIIYRGNDNYYLSATSALAAGPAGGVWRDGDAAPEEAIGPDPIEPEAWTHLAATYDGSALRLYVNGIEVSNRALSGDLTTSDHPLEIGGDSLYGQFFAGAIDEVRVFSVARSGLQIQADMASGLIDPGLVGCTATAEFDTPFVGTNKTVSVSNISLIGPAAGNYTLSSNVGTSSAAVTPLVVTPTVLVADKTYDARSGTSILSCTLPDLVAGDDVSCSGSAAFDTPDVGVNKAVSASVVLTGAASGNYLPTSTTTTATITPAIVAPSVTAASKVYNGSPSATLTSCTLTDVVAGDIIQCNGSATFDSAAVGTGRTVTVVDLALAGPEAGNYNLSATTATTTASITPLRATPIITAANKRFDSTTIASLTSCALVPEVSTAKPMIVSWDANPAEETVAGYVIRIGTASGSYQETFDVGTQTYFTFTNPIAGQEYFFSVAAYNLVGNGESSEISQFGQPVALVAGDAVGCEGPAVFDSPAMGTNKTVTASPLALTGASADNYTLSTSTATTLATITGGAVSPTVVITSKQYNGTTTATIASCTLIGAAPEDDVSCAGIATFDSPATGDGKTVTVTGLALTGTTAGNYSLSTTTTTTTGDIAPAFVTPLVVIGTKIYDGTTSAAIASCSVVGALGEDEVTCVGTATFGGPDAGAGKTVTVTNLSLIGPDAGNYQLVDPNAPVQPLVSLVTSGAIEPSSVTAVLSVANKSYDRTTSATLSCALTGVLAGDSVGCTGSATFGSPDAGADKAVAVTALSLTEEDAGNYVLAATTATTNASITPVAVTPSIIVANKRYDGTTGATVTGCTLSGVVGGDVVNCSAIAAFASAAAGNNKLVTATQVILGGSAAANYALSTTAPTTTASIAANSLPSITNPGSQAGYQSIGLLLALTASDADGDPLLWSAQSLVPGTTINPSTGLISGTPTTQGNFTVAVSVFDGWDTTQVSFSWAVASPVPVAAAPASPVGSITSTTPTFTWPAVPLVEYYLLWITDSGADSPLQVWYTPAQAGCASSGTCVAPSPRVLKAGLVTWKVITWNHFGYGPWSDLASAIVDLSDPSVPTPTTLGPSGAIGTRTPTYAWSPVANATWYQLSITDVLNVVREFWYTPSQVCTSSCAANPTSPVAVGLAKWRVRAWGMTGAGGWSGYTSFDAADGVPGTPTLLAPSGSITNSTPSFTWNAVGAASYYLLRIIDRDNVINERWYRPIDVACLPGSGTCTANPGIVLKAGAATWKVLAWNGSGYGGWSDDRTILIEIADVAAPAPTPVSPLTTLTGGSTAYRWTAVPAAINYRLSIRSNGGAPIYFWYSPSAAGCDTGSDCSIVPLLSRTNGAEQWQVQAWTNTGYSPWSALVSLTVDIPAPSAPIPVSPAGLTTATTVFKWNAVANTTYYYIRVFDSTGQRVDKWPTPAQVGCGSGGVCTFTTGVTLASGAGAWQVLSWNPSGYSPWSATIGFTIP